MKNMLFILTLLLLTNGLLYPQTIFYDGFETGDFSKWSENVGGVISSAIKRSGNYSAKFEVAGFNQLKKIVKYNPPTDSIRIDFYAYITHWYQSLAGLNVGGNGLLWCFQVNSQNGSCAYNCMNQLIGQYNVYFPMNQWVHIRIKRIKTGYLYVWINNIQFVDGAFIGTCINTDFTIGFNTWNYSATSGYITGYIDDVSIYYAPIGIKSISSEVPENYFLFQNYPNPFNPTTNIKFDIPQSSMVNLVVYDVLGREVETLVNENLSAGTYSVDWNASQYSSGVYFYKLSAGDFTDTKRMMMIK